MTAYYQNSESSLKRANEFYEIGKLNEAIECLFDTLKNRKNRMMKQQIHESVINKFLELCVQLKKSQTAKDGLYSYRNMCLGVNTKSWEDAISKYMQLAESAVENALVLSQFDILDVDDLDQDVTPECLLKFVSREDSQDRTERVLLLPSIKFQWECFRNCLDLLRYTQTSKLYHTVAQSAFKFCVKYSRKTELRKLCNILKINTAHIQKRQAILKSDNTETQQLFLETGFVQLESTMSMEVWQDAFKAVEEIHSIIAVSKKSLHSKTMAHYFEKLLGVFWKSEELLFHAAAVFRYFLICRDQKKNFNSDEITKLACRVLLSVMSVPFPSIYPANDFVTEMDLSATDKKNRLLSNLLDSVKCPTRSSLIKDAIRLNIIQYVPKEFEELFYGIERDMEPTQISLLISRTVSYIDVWKGCNLKQYIPLLQKVGIIRLLSTLPKMYINITIPKLLKLSGMSCLTFLEIIVVNSARKYGFPLRIDHRQQCIHFSPNFNIFKKETALSEYQGDFAFPDTGLKCLKIIRSAVTEVVQCISPDYIKAKNQKVADEIKTRFHKEWNNYRKKILLRKNVIERYKENMENIRLRKEEEEKRHIANKLLELETAEKIRLLKESNERNLQRFLCEQEAVKRKIISETVEKFKRYALDSQIVENFDLNDMNDLDPEVLLNKQIQQLNKFKKEKIRKLRRQERNLDHMERAKRMDEIPLLVMEHEKNKESDKKIFEEDECSKIELALRNREKNLLKKSRLLSMKGDVENFLELLRKKRQSLYIEEMKRFTKVVNEEKAIRLKPRAAHRKIERQNKWLAEQISLKRKQEKSRKGRKSLMISKDVVTKKEQPNCEETNNNKVHLSLYPMNCFKLSNNELVTNSASKKNHEMKAKSRERTKLSTCEILPKFSRKQYFEDHNRQYALEAQENRRTERFEHDTTFYSKFSSRFHNSRTENYRSSFNISNHCIKGDDCEFSWQLSGLRNKTKHINYVGDDACSSKVRSSNNKVYDRPFKYQPLNGDIPYGTVTIARRKDTKSEIPKAVKNPITEKPSKSEPCTDKKDAEHSCTPWAKLKRQNCDE